MLLIIKMQRNLSATVMCTQLTPNFNGSFVTLTSHRFCFYMNCQSGKPFNRKFFIVLAFRDNIINPVGSTLVLLFFYNKRLKYILDIGTRYIFFQ